MGSLFSVEYPLASYISVHQGRSSGMPRDERRRNRQPRDPAESARTIQRHRNLGQLVVTSFACRVRLAAILISFSRSVVR